MSHPQSSNTHIAAAEFRMEGIHEWQGEEGMTDATLICTALDALVESNLAVAYEQRTANLLALHGQMILTLDANKGNEEAMEEAEKLTQAIAERLDLV